MREVDVKIYKYEELNEKAKEKAKQKLCESFNDVHSEEITQTMMNIVEDNKKFQIETDKNSKPKIYYSLSHCQGDGVSFEAKVNINEFCEELHKIIIYHLPDNEEKILKAIEKEDIVLRSRIIKNTHRYQHEYTMAVDSDFSVTMEQFWDIAAELTGKLEVSIINAAKELAKEMEKAGYKEIEWQWSDEYIIMLCEGNDYEFYEDGRFYVS